MTEPKFRKSDRVRVLWGNYAGREGIVKKADSTEWIEVRIDIENYSYWFKENELEKVETKGESR